MGSPAEADSTMQENPYASPGTDFDSTDASSQAIAAEVISQLARTKPWVRFISVMIFIGAGLLLLLGLFMGLGGGAAMFFSAGGVGGAEAGIGIAVMLLYIAIAALYIYPGLKLWNYASRIGILIRSCQTMDLVSALNEQRAFWKFIGILAVIVMALYLVIIPIGIFGALSTAGSIP
jgi:hypothetical protein